MFDRLVALVRIVVDWGRVACLGILGLVMLVVFGIGVYEVALAALTLVTSLVQQSEQQTLRAITALLKGIEFFFLAPLGLLTFKALVRYVKVQLNDGSADAAAAAREKAAAEGEIHQVKVLIGTLIAAFLVANLVSKAVVENSASDLQALLPELLVLAATLCYVWSLPRTDHPAPKT